jgi:CHAT domain-containing protein
MWDKFEARFAAEHFLAPQLGAQEIIDRFTGPGEMDDTEVRAVLTVLPWSQLQALSYRLVDLIGPGPLQAAAQPGWTPRSPREQRLFELLHVVMPLVRVRDPGQRSLTQADMPAARQGQRIDAEVDGAAARATAGEALPADVVSLRVALRDYRALLAGQAWSPGGQHLLRSRIAFLLDCLGRAAETRHADVIAEAFFAAAQAEYTAVGDQPQAAVCAQKSTAAADRQRRDADHRMQRLLADLAVAPEPSLNRVEALLGLAELASGHGDRYEATQRLDEAVGELTTLGYAPPGPEGGPAAVDRWIDAIPPGADGEPLYFSRAIAGLLTLQERVAKLQIILTPDAARPNATLFELAQITAEIPRHARAVEERLQARLAGHVPVSVRRDGPGPPDDDWLVVMRTIDALLVATEKLPTDKETLARLRTEAADCVRRARRLGQPVALAQALEMEARVHIAGRQPDVAIALLEDAYSQVAGLSGELEHAQAIQAASHLAKAYLEIPDLAGAGAAAGRAIALIERDRYRVSAPFQQGAYLAAHLDVFTTGIYCAWQLKDYDTMLQRMELSKARASVRNLLRSASPGSAPESQAATRSPLLSAAQLDQELRDLTAAIHQQIPAAKREELRARRRQLWDLRAVALRDPEAATPPVTVASVQAALDADEVAVSYYWLRPAILLVITINADEIAVERMKLTAEERQRLDSGVDELGQLQGSNLGLDAAFIDPLARALTPVAGAPLMQGRTRLVVSPHRLLHWYPFAAMPYSGRPLIRSFTIRYVPNLASLVIPRRPKRARPAQGAQERARVVAVTVSTFPGRELSAIPQVIGEAEESLAAYRTAGISTATLSEATRAGFTAAVQQGTLTGTWCLHMATHGHSVADDIARDAPMESTLELADGPLDGFEIALARLDSELVVLAACDAGQLAVRGRGLAEQPGDELFGLPAAFLESGCDAVLAPGWPADTTAAVTVIVSFHRHLASGQAADVALALAQREYLDAAGYKERHAYYWAPYHLIVVGRPDAGPGSADKEISEGHVA